MMRVLLLLAVLLAPGMAGAVEPSEQLANPALEARARALGETLRCLVCQNESIEQSNAPLAHDIRVLLRQRLVAGDSNAEVRRYLGARYGEFVLLKPPVMRDTLLLWFGPVLVLALAAVGVGVHWKRRRRQEPAALTAAEREQLARLLKDSET
jgi:cytochrome c-type biogenesis protein CcmH